MARLIDRLNPKMIAGLSDTGLHADGKGLYLAVREGGSKQGVFVYRHAGKRRELGLGGLGTVSLKEARQLADQHRASVNIGKDPKAERVSAKAKALAALSTPAPRTFGEVADVLVQIKASEAQNDKHRGQWAMTLTKYAGPLRGLPVAEVKTEHVLSVLKPLWNKVPETARRLRQRIGAVIDHARAAGDVARDVPNPAGWEGNLKQLLPRRDKHSRGHHAAMAYAEIPAFISRLRECDMMTALALEFTILTAARTGEALGARWDEIDEAGSVWTVPA